MSPSHSLKTLTEVLLFSDKSGINLLNTCKALHDFFVKISGIEPENQSYKKDISLAHGTAIGSTWAGMCVLDFIRTQRFLQSIYRAILRKQESVNERPVRILYIGCGPFAALLTPLLSILKPEDVQCVLVEINPLSIKAVQNTIHNLKFENHISEIISCDILKYQIQKENEPDIVICEIMQAGLRKEPQVAIFRHIGKQISASAIIIPEVIHVHLGILHSSRQHDSMMGLKTPGSYLKTITNLISLDKNSYQLPATCIGSEKCSLASRDIQLPAYEEGFDRLCILTEITLYDTFCIKNQDSALTIPIICAQISEENSAKYVKVHYELSSNPEFKIKFQTIDPS